MNDNIAFCLRTSTALANAACPPDDEKDRPYVQSPHNDYLHRLAWWWFVAAHR